MTQLLMHTSSGKYATLKELYEIPVPVETPTYKPVSHYDLAKNLVEVSGTLLKDYELERSQYGLARDGNQLFGVHTYRNGSDSMGLSIGFRNSYDKSMSVGIAIGASVFVCDNLALTGEIAIARKHTSNVWQDLEALTITTIYRSQNNFTRIVEDAQVMQGQHLTDNDAYRLIGLLYGNGIITPRQIPVVKKEWLTPSHEEFEDRSVWSMYNAVTEALKTAPPTKIMEKHIALHQLLAPTNRELSLVGR
ncbi:MAG: DUF932 domain-containing protein [Candidatus Marinimicrobia bacterium]|jgi:hypothetical protein|nr:DUF932 domain-containing protein [Candidatus Neomarinimicrobiota bacterium]MBT7829573.1 DUF932 domain-containing protein [Candidatus Neomarinimicrobiota bacterium]